MAYRRGRYFHECPFCGASLDPGEICDCSESAAKQEGSPADINTGEDKPGRMQPVFGGGSRSRERATA